MRRLSFLLIFISVLLVGCNNAKKSTNNLFNSKSGNASRTIGWDADQMKSFGFTDPTYIEQETGPGLVFVQGGTFMMGRIDEDVMKDWDNKPRRVTIASFYVDETEVTNFDYRTYMTWLQKMYPSNPEKARNAVPDTLVWRKELAYNEPYVNNYLRHPSYSNYPVVGVSWIQANEYCKWRTDRVNEYLLIKNGIIELDSAQQGANVFTTEGYLNGHYTPKEVVGKNGEVKKIRWENGLLVPNYRLLTEAEWEYAALGLIGEANGELLKERRMYPWSGRYIRQEKGSTSKGKMKANYTRGSGDLMGMAGALNDAADISADVFSFEPNDYGLYCMAGNVNEWTADVYRPLSSEDVEEFQPFRGNVITQYRLDSDKKIVFDEFGQPVVDTIADYRNYTDGDYRTKIKDANDWNASKPATPAKNNATTASMYIQESNTGVISSTITDNIRVYKGGSWKDRAYWLNPGSRRYLDQRESAADLGFRCAMTRLGPPVAGPIK